jgi:hypothetical protein
MKTPRNLRELRKALPGKNYCSGRDSGVLRGCYALVRHDDQGYLQWSIRVECAPTKAAAMEVLYKGAKSFERARKGRG